MNKRTFIAAAFLVLTTTSPAQPQNAMITDLLKDAKLKLAPDRRTTVFDVTGEASGEGKAIVLKGEIHSAPLKAKLLEFLKGKGDFQIVDSLVTLPDKSLGDQTYALVSVSVANIRAKPEHDQEMVSQSLLGTPVRLLKRRGPWLYIQTPDRYLGWTIDHLTRMDRATFGDWCTRPKVIATAAFGFTHVAPDNKSDVVSDYTVGCLFALKAEKDRWFEVQYPDGRTAFLSKEEAAEYAGWMSHAEDAPDRIVTTARRFFGIPYLWGGTSSKGLDCSGFTKTVYYLNGVLLPRDASQQYTVGEPVDTSNGLAQARTGDLLFFGSRATSERPQKVTHVAIYLGAGKFIHAPGASSAPGITINSFTPTDREYDEHRHRSFLGARRIIGSGETTGVRRLKDIEYYNGHAD